MIKAIIIDAGGVLFQNYVGEGPINKPLLELLAVYKKSHKLGVISSTSCDLKGILEKSGLGDLFSFILTTGETGLDKAQADIYIKGAKMLDLAGDEIVFIDNESQYIKAAASTGMKTIYYTDFEACKEQLTHYLTL